MINARGGSEDPEIPGSSHGMTYIAFQLFIHINSKNKKLEILIVFNYRRYQQKVKIL